MGRAKTTALVVAAMASVALLLSGCGSGEATGSTPPPQPAPVRKAAGVTLYPLPRPVASACRRLGRKVGEELLCPTVLPRPTRGLSSAAEIPDEFHVFPLRDGSGISGVSINYSAEASSPRRNQPARFLHFDVQTRAKSDRLPIELRAAKIGGIEGAYAPPRSENYSSEPYFANHARFFWRRGTTLYAATLHDFGRRTRRLLGALIRSLVPASEVKPPPQPGEEGVRTTPLPLAPVSLAPRSGGGLWVAGMARGASHLLGVEESGARSGGRPLEISRYLAVVALASRGRELWVAQRGFHQPDLLRLNPAGSGFSPAFTAGMDLIDLALGEKGDIWALDLGRATRQGAGRGTLEHLPKGGRRTLSRTRVGRAPAAVALGEGGVWVANSLDGTVSRIDPRTARVTATTKVGRSPVAVAAGAGAVWVANADSGTLSRLDPATARVTATIEVGGAPRAVTAGAGAVWVANYLDDSVSRVDPATNAVASTLAVGAGPYAILAAGDGVWVANRLDRTLSRIEP